MLFYLIFFSILIGLSITYQVTKNKVIIYIAFFLLFLFSALRYDIGWDYPLYFSIAANHNFSNISGIDWHYKRMEPLIKVIIDFSRFLNNPFVFFIITSSLTVLFISKATIRLSKYPDISILILLAYPHLFIESFGIVRQWIAVSIFLWSLKYVLENKFWHFLVTIFIANLFHASAMVTLLVYPIRKIKPTFIFILSLTILTFLVGKFAINFFITHKLPYVYYFLNKEGEGGSFFGYMNIIILIVLLVVKYYKKDTDNRFNLLFLLYFIGTLLSLLLMPFGHVAFRSSVYFIVVLAFIAPDIITYVKQKTAIYFSLTAMSIVLLMVNLQINGKGKKDPYIPYKTILQADSHKMSDN